MKNKKKLKTKKPTSPKLSERKIAFKNVQKVDEYIQFIRFCSLPRALRDSVFGAKDQTEFAEKFGLHMDTLTDWKKKAGFWDEVFAVRKDFFKERTGDVLLAMETKAIRTGDAAESNSMLKYTGELQAENDPSAVPEAVANAIAKIFQVLK